VGVLAELVDGDVLQPVRQIRREAALYVMWGYRSCWRRSSRSAWSRSPCGWCSRR
jgi:hypothetical protein